MKSLQETFLLGSQEHWASVTLTAIEMYDERDDKGIIHLPYMLCCFMKLQATLLNENVS
jgi:hypothetical protein